MVTFKATLQCSINGTLCFSKFPKSLENKWEAACAYFANSLSVLLSISNISSFRLLLLGIGKPLFTDGSIIPHARGVQFSLAHFISLPSLSCNETGTIRKHWNQAKKYMCAETGSEIHAVVCGLKVQKPCIFHVVRKISTNKASVHRSTCTGT